MESDRRRVQIVEAALDLLAELPPDALTTRAIALRVGVTQPALFRHFATREDLLLAVVATARAELRGLIPTAGAPLEQIQQLVRALAAYAGRHPGLPRLLFADVAGGGDARLAAALRELIDGQRAVVASLVREAAPAVDADAAAGVLVAGLQGTMAQARRGGRPPDVDALLQMWVAGIAAGVPALAVPPTAAPWRDPGEVVDARPLLAVGIDPLETVLAAVARMAPGGRLDVIAPFRPAPLEDRLRRLGLRVDVVPAEGAWTLRAERP